LFLRTTGAVLLSIGVVRAGLDLANTAQMADAREFGGGAGHIHFWISGSLADLSTVLFFIGALAFCGSFFKPTQRSQP
jgi:hypothetical protein